ncbi:MAG TPA: hypothetical protein VKE22_28850 [Haliangiales bacterium]|nr:hypothetical protein [Haliangiales bacterium]
MKRNLLVMVFLAAGVARAQEQLNVGLYAPAAAFADSSARLAYVQGLAKAIQQKTGLATVGRAYVRLADLTAVKPELAVIDGQCLAGGAMGQVLATATLGGDTAPAWGLYARGADNLAGLKGKKLAYVRTGCRDNDFLDNAMLGGEVKAQSYFGSLVDKPDVSGAVLAVRDYKQADAVFAPAAQAKGLTKVFDVGPVPAPGFVVLAKGLPAPVLEQVKDAVLGYGGGGGIDGWKAASQQGYTVLSGRMAPRTRRPVFAAPEVVRVDDQDVLVVPTSKFAEAPVRQHFWEPTAGGD